MSNMSLELELFTLGPLFFLFIFYFLFLKQISMQGKMSMGEDSRSDPALSMKNE